MQCCCCVSLLHYFATAHIRHSPCTRSTGCSGSGRTRSISRARRAGPAAPPSLRPQPTATSQSPEESARDSPNRFTCTSLLNETVLFGSFVSFSGFFTLSPSSVLSVAPVSSVIGLSAPCGTTVSVSFSAVSVSSVLSVNSGRLESGVKDCADGYTLSGLSELCTRRRSC